MKVLAVFGTRPEAIKMAPVVRAIGAVNGIESRVCVTAQHRAMLDQVLKVFEIHPDHDLDVMVPGQTLSETTGRILMRVDPVLLEFQPDIVLVHGDTTTAAAVTLASYYRRVRVGHVEAGLRTGDLESPWPEEGNRRMIAALATVHFAPTEQARGNLLREGIAPAAIHVTGNTVIDSLRLVSDRLRNDACLRESIVRRFAFLRSGTRLVLITCHRRENLPRGIERICAAIRDLSVRFVDVDFVYPVHPNPQIHGLVSASLHGIDNVHLTGPLDYLPFVHLMNRASLLLTDSGGVQEEATALGKPALVLRDTTERPESISTGTTRLVGTDTMAIVQAASCLLEGSDAVGGPPAHTPYGDGRAGERIARIVQSLGIH